MNIYVVFCWEYTVKKTPAVEVNHRGHIFTSLAFKWLTRSVNIAINSITQKVWAIFNNLCATSTDLKKLSKKWHVFNTPCVLLTLWAPVDSRWHHHVKKSNLILPYLCNSIIETQLWLKAESSIFWPEITKAIISTSEVKSVGHHIRSPSLLHSSEQHILHDLCNQHPRRRPLHSTQHNLHLWRYPSHSQIF